eukprot:COSAG05_NODE_1952_length_3792_cov_7.187111_8_plen_284_part_01
MCAEQVLWHLLPMLLLFDYTLEEAPINWKDESSWNAQQIRNYLATQAIAALKALAGGDTGALWPPSCCVSLLDAPSIDVGDPGVPTPSPPHEDITGSLSALLTSGLMYSLPNPAHCALRIHSAGNSSVHLELTGIYPMFCEYSCEISAVSWFADGRGRYSLEVSEPRTFLAKVTSNAETDDLIWNAANRAELQVLRPLFPIISILDPPSISMGHPSYPISQLSVRQDMCERQLARVRDGSFQAAPVRNFVYTSIANELSINGAISPSRLVWRSDPVVINLHNMW